MAYKNFELILNITHSYFLKVDFFVLQSFPTIKNYLEKVPVSDITDDQQINPILLYLFLPW